MAAVDDMKRLLSLIPGGADVNRKLAEFEAYIRAQAQAGAEQAIPTIKKSIEPYFMAAFALGGLGVLLGLSAHRKLNQKRLT